MDTLTALNRLEKTIEAQCQLQLQAHGVLTCLYEVLLHAECDEAVLYAQATYVARGLIDKSAEGLNPGREICLNCRVGQRGLSSTRGGVGAVTQELALCYQGADNSPIKAWHSLHGGGAPLIVLSCDESASDACALYMEQHTEGTWEETSNQ